MLADLRAADRRPDGPECRRHADQNPLTTPFTGLTPGDVYAVPTPQPTTPVTFLGAASILSPPFNQNTLPLIVPGPQITEHASAPGSSTGTDNLILNGTTSSFNVTFDRPMQVSTFTPGQVLQIMGPTGSVSGPQYFASDRVGQTIPAATRDRPRHAQLDADRPELQRHVQGRQAHRPAQRRLPDGFRRSPRS